MFLQLLACGDERGLREGDELVAYSGYVLRHTRKDDAEVEVLEEGSVTFAPSGSDAVEAEPYEGYAGYWYATLPADAAFTLRIEGDDMYPAVWAGVAPSASAIWFSGALFGADTEYVDAAFDALELREGEAIEDLDETRVHVWGEAIDGSTWDCAAVRVAGEPPICFAADDEGLLQRVDAGPIDYFYAFNLAPGDIVVESGQGSSTTYPTSGGEIVYAWWFVAEGE